MRCLLWISSTLMALACSNTLDLGANDAAFGDDATLDVASPADSGSGNDSASGDGGDAGDGGLGLTGFDAGGSRFFTCGESICDSTTQYCRVLELPSFDGGYMVTTQTCEPYPNSCGLDAGDTATCQCIFYAQFFLCLTCSQTGPDFTLTCEQP